jgi:hypothetical protein
MQMSIFPFRAILVVLVGGSAAVFANMIAFIMVGKVNEKSSEGDRVSYWTWDGSIRRKYKRLYPESKLVLAFDLTVIVMLLCFPVRLWQWVFAN